MNLTIYYRFHQKPANSKSAASEESRSEFACDHPDCKRCDWPAAVGLVAFSATIEIRLCTLSSVSLPFACLVPVGKRGGWAVPASSSSQSNAANQACCFTYKDVEEHIHTHPRNSCPHTYPRTYTYTHTCTASREDKIKMR